MNHWLMKTEPDTWSWDDQVAKGVEPWNGVRNHQACNHMRDMAKGDKAFFYHSGKDRQIMGIVTIHKTFHPDPTDDTGKFGMVSVKPDKPLKTPVTLAQVKADKRLADMVLVKNSRLSVQPVTDKQWRIIREMGGLA